jgi:hypothetical protein
MRGGLTSPLCTGHPLFASPPRTAFARGGAWRAWLAAPFGGTWPSAAALASLFGHGQGKGTVSVCAQMPGEGGVGRPFTGEGKQQPPPRRLESSPSCGEKATPIVGEGGETRPKANQNLGHSRSHADCLPRSCSKGAITVKLKRRSHDGAGPQI